MAPLPLDPNYIPSEAELLSEAKLLKQLHGIVEACGYIKRASVALDEDKPWSAVARMTVKTEPSAHVWSRANESRIACAKACDKQWKEIRKSGLWRDTLRYHGRRSRVRFAVLRLYCAAFLHTFFVLGILDLRKDQELLTAWCK